LQALPFQQFHVLFNSLSKVLFIFRSLYLCAGLTRGVGPGDNPGLQYARMLLRLADPEDFPRLTAAMTQRAAEPPADFADDAFRFGLATILDGIACQA